MGVGLGLGGSNMSLLSMLYCEFEPKEGYEKEISCECTRCGVNILPKTRPRRDLVSMSLV